MLQSRRSQRDTCDLVTEYTCLSQEPQSATNTSLGNLPPSFRAVLP